MKQDPIIKVYRRSLRKDRRKQFWKLSHVILLALLSASTVILSAVSYILRKQAEWFSNMILSVAMGIFTGLIVYILGNLRTQKERYLCNTKKELDELDALENRIFALTEYKKHAGSVSDAECAAVLHDALKAAGLYVDAIGKLDSSLFKKLCKNEYFDYQAMRHKLDEIQESFLSAADSDTYFAIGTELDEMIQNSSYLLFEERENIKTQLRQMAKYPV